MTDQPPSRARPIVAVIGDGDPRGPDAHRLLEWAEEVGHMAGAVAATVVTGGLGGVMRAASRGAVGAGGRRSASCPDPTRPRRTSTWTPIATGLGGRQPRGRHVGRRRGRRRRPARHAVRDRAGPAHGAPRGDAQLVAARGRWPLRRADDPSRQGSPWRRPPLHCVSRRKVRRLISGGYFRRMVRRPAVGVNWWHVATNIGDGAVGLLRLVRGRSRPHLHRPTNDSVASCKAVIAAGDPVIDWRAMARLPECCPGH